MTTLSTQRVTLNISGQAYGPNEPPRSVKTIELSFPHNFMGPVRVLSVLYLTLL